jgi:hypothetical protein
MAVYPVNGPCDALYPQETLLSLRTRLMRRLGYSAQAANPPPGMKELLDDFLQEAQQLVYSDYAIFRTQRFYDWPLIAGERFYAYGDGTDGACTKRLDPEKIIWVGISQDSTANDAGFWHPLWKGINPVMYGSPATGTGWPSNYQLGQYLEVWPAPTVSGGTLRVKGNFGLAAFAVDADKTTADPQTIFLRALANAKYHYNQPDAGNYRAQEEMRVMNLVAASHATSRYIPGLLWADEACYAGAGISYNGSSGPWNARNTDDGALRITEDDYIRTIE